MEITYVFHFCVSALGHESSLFKTLLFGYHWVTSIPGSIWNPNRNPKRDKRQPKPKQERFKKMATPVKQGDISKKELMDAYGKLKTRTKRANEVAKKEGEAMMNNLITVASAGGMGWYLGDANKKAVKGKTGEAAIKAAKKATQVSGVDIDLLVGGGALAAGMMKWGGKFSPTLSAVGTGVLGGYAFRRGLEAGMKPNNNNS